MNSRLSGSIDARNLKEAHIVLFNYRMLTRSLAKFVLFPRRFCLVTLALAIGKVSQWVVVEIVSEVCLVQSL